MRCYKITVNDDIIQGFENGRKRYSNYPSSKMLAQNRLRSKTTFAVFETRDELVKYIKQNNFTIVTKLAILNQPLERNGKKYKYLLDDDVDAVDHEGMLNALGIQEHSYDSGTYMTDHIVIVPKQLASKWYMDHLPTVINKLKPLIEKTLDDEYCYTINKLLELDDGEFRVFMKDRDKAAVYSIKQKLKNNTVLEKIFASYLTETDNKKLAETTAALLSFFDRYSELYRISDELCPQHAVECHYMQDADRYYVCSNDITKESTDLSKALGGTGEEITPKMLASKLYSKQIQNVVKSEYAEFNKRTDVYVNSKDSKKKLFKLKIKK